jgi:hypothetical protein
MDTDTVTVTCCIVCAVTCLLLLLLLLSHDVALHMQVSFNAESAIPAMLLVQDFFLSNEVRLEGCIAATVQYNTVQYNTVQYNTIQYSTIQYNTIQYSTIQYRCWGQGPSLVTCQQAKGSPGCPQGLLLDVSQSLRSGVRAIKISHQASGQLQ